MAPQIEDRYLWLGLGVFAFVAVKTIAYGLHHIVTLTEIHNSSPNPRDPTTTAITALPNPNPSSPSPNPQTKEDTIKTSSLLTLATCANIEIRRAATKILCDRYMSHRSAKRLLIEDLRSSDPETVHRAELAQALLSEYSATTRAMRIMATQAAARAAYEDGLVGRGAELRGAVPGVEERDLRRRRREAMVLNEGDRPVSEEDVWMRDRDGGVSMVMEERWEDRM
ncbi:unnamed protein product [Periconia digitata]|uniref:Uncharacterized protein n=1 Tax=Periconia digitata TaxID=1303443 RepID=A0A9W4XEW5_9PLEO|nr:unnamed protein product [Periconia digitata]